MAYLQARSGIARSGVTYAGWTPPSFTLWVNGVAVLPLYDSWVLTDQFGARPTLTFKLRTTPVQGHDVKLTYATPNEYWFGGTLLQREVTPFKAGASNLIWTCTAVGYAWLLDRYDLVLARFASMGANVLVARLLAEYTNGGFRVGYVPSTIGDIDMEFSFDTVSAALARIGAAVGSTPRIGFDKVVDVCATYPEAALPTVTEAQILVGSLHYKEDLTQVRTRVLVAVSGSTVATAAGSGSATLTVENTANFAPAGGLVRVGPNLITYTTRSTASGRGDLTGITGLTHDVAVGDAIQAVVETEDTSAQTALAAVLGGGLSGLATHYVEYDGRLNRAIANRSITEAALVGQEQLDTFSTQLPELTFTYTTPQRHLRAGRLLTVSITDPFAVSGTFLVQRVTTTLRGDQVGGTKVAVFQTVDASRFTRSLTDLLNQLPG